LALTALISSPLSARAVDLGAKHKYDIPVAPLDRALPQFAEQAEIEILFDPHVAAGRVSDPVHGTFVARDALRLLLERSGLMFNFTSARSVVVYQPGARQFSDGNQPNSLRLDLDTMSVTAPRLIGGGSRAAFMAYAQAAQADIRRILMQAHLKAPDNAQRTRISTHVDSSGQLFEVEVLRQSGNPAQDKQISSLLTGLQMTRVPPPDLPQPLIFDLGLE